ncbi:MAG: lytic transglycosylase domain-containing protein [Alphaproteobacteria bacterium]|nr:lytic transglycosylase domain-containing protein [Alphaproteobacteria bacterium]
MVREAELPAILGTADIARYRAIKTLQDEGRWSVADSEIAALEDPILLGHVLAQRYLHRGYKMGYAALQAWLARYADLPEAHAIHELARKRRPAGTHAPAEPEGEPIALRGIVDDPADLRPPMRANAGDSAGRAKAEIRRLARTDPDVAEHVLGRSDSEHLLGDADYDDARADVVEGYLFAGETQKALLLSETTRTPAFAALADWDAGIAAWRLGKLGEARTHFETLARTPGLSSWNLAAAAFWAARVQTRSRHADAGRYWLSVAADQPRSFYGLLARRMLGLDTYFNFEPEIFTNINLEALTGIPAARRAMALLQLGATAAAELELRTLANGAPATLYPALAALADRGNMPALSVQLATMLSAADGRRHDHALFPMPRWRPMGGFTVDRALLFGLMRQESQFLPEAESSAGAVGLMQLMPDTASELADRAGIKLPASGKTGRGLTDPEVNLTLGQKYLKKLLDHDQIRGNLILFAAAYNSGPTNLLRWRARPEYDKDPLLFLESLPSRETRIFTERVLTNYWVYRLQLGQPTRDLDMLAAGDWPVYVALDASTKQVASNAAPR